MNTLNPTHWGWKKENNEFFPVQTDISPAPENLLKILRCNCQSDCNSRSCTCRKHDLKCSSACGHCRGTACLNSVQVDGENSLETYFYRINQIKNFFVYYIIYHAVLI